VSEPLEPGLELLVALVDASTGSGSPSCSSASPTRAALQQHRGWSAGAQELLATRLTEEMDRALDARLEVEPPDSPLRQRLEGTRREIASLARAAGTAVAQEFAKGHLPT
jgi:hypothetical protein